MTLRVIGKNIDVGDSLRERLQSLDVDALTPREALDLLYVTTINPTEFGGEAEEGSGYVYVIEGLGTRGVPEARYRG